MDFQWDETKRRANLRKHGLDFDDARRVFDDFYVEILDDREDYGEDRYIAVGLLVNNVVVVVYAPRENADVVRIISMRNATSVEERHYWHARDKAGHGKNSDPAG